MQCEALARLDGPFIIPTFHSEHSFIRTVQTPTQAFTPFIFSVILLTSLSSSFEDSLSFLLYHASAILLVESFNLLFLSAFVPFLAPPRRECQHNQLR